MPESKRIREIRNGIIEELPRFNRNDKASKKLLEEKSLGSLFINYFNWRMRFVSQGKRSVTIKNTAKNDLRWNELEVNVANLLRKVRNGDDLSPHLSLAAWQKGYTPEAEKQGAKDDRWADKDFLLNVMGFHHFHLGTNIEKKGIVTRTDVVLFAYVTRTKFIVLGLFDHSVFDNEDSSAMTNERKRLWELYDEVTLDGVEPGTVVIRNLIAESGHSLMVVSLSQHYAKTIQNIDPKLDDQEYLETEVYGLANIPVPDKPDLHWACRHLDLFLIDKTIPAYFLVHRGPF